ncbi:Gfo/Idh/MocA family oxidoreductase [Solwaraspora sp. WMMD791]|uniref:Gfo/Idh/MocA family protein n=1 Tax=Solwaraspora sp. WMMD791 TaxID=3016086 RepID=UPI00249C9F4E|nr:Gfo/Idh/MocA family oxidoreductase [Solwaraspora sp. WMMD791]WFE27009.1 Gfo/Idh/MocA family oxidoreductase [Solwaraspora sp. WMMD791]
MALRFGLFGTGHWAAQTHAVGLAGHPGARLVGVWGRDPAKAEVLAARHGAAAYREVDALLDDVDAVAVAVPPDVQAPIAVRAAEAGRHLLLDKPLAVTLDDADRIVAAAQRRQVASVVFFTSRFNPGMVEFLARSADGARSADSAGPTGGVWHGARGALFAAISEPGNPYGASPWRHTYGGLWDIGPHVLSIVLPVLGPVADVAAMDGPAGGLHLLLRHTGGAVSSLSLNLDGPPAAKTFDVTFFGEPGIVPVPHRDVTVVQAFHAAVDALVGQVAEGRPGHPCDVRFGREVVAVLAAAQAARTQRRTVVVAG